MEVNLTDLPRSRRMVLVWVTTQVMRPDRPLQRGFPGIPKTRKGFVRSAGGCRDGRGARIPAHGCMRTRAAAHAMVRPGVLYTATGPSTIVVVGPVGGRSEEHTSELQ